MATVISENELLRRENIRKAHLGRKRPKEVGEKIRLKKLGHTVSPETRLKISLAKKGSIPPNKGKKGLQVSWIKGKKHSEEARLKMSLSKKGKPSNSPYTQFKNGDVPWSKGTKGLMKAWNKGRHKYSPIGIENEKDYRNWVKNIRNRVIKRIKEYGLGHSYGDWILLKRQYEFTCPCCKKQEPEIKLTEDHIIPISKGGSDLIENIQPLCLSCNVRKHTRTIKY